MKPAPSAFRAFPLVLSLGLGLGGAGVVGCQHNAPGTPASTTGSDPQDNNPYGPGSGVGSPDSNPHKPNNRQSEPSGSNGATGTGGTGGPSGSSGTGAAGAGH